MFSQVKIGDMITVTFSEYDVLKRRTVTGVVNRFYGYNVYSDDNRQRHELVIELLLVGTKIVKGHKIDFKDEITIYVTGIKSIKLRHFLIEKHGCGFSRL